MLIEFKEMAESNDCKAVLSSDIEAITNAFKSSFTHVCDKIVLCFYNCYKEIFIKWALIIYNSYPEDFVVFISNTSFTDSILKFKETAVNNNLYKSNATVKTILFSFYKMKLRENLQKEKRAWEKEKNIKLLHTENAVYINTEDVNPSEKMYLCIEMALEKMEPTDKQIIIWRHVEEKSNEEISKILGITKASATNRIYRCMERLREITEKLIDP